MENFIMRDLLEYAKSFLHLQGLETSSRTAVVAVGTA